METFKEYLEKLGLLVDFSDKNLTEEDKSSIRERIKLAKKEYRSIYVKKQLKEWKNKHKKFEVFFNKEGRNNEWDYIKRKAEKAKMKVPAFIKQCLMAYLKGCYVVPDRDQIDKLIKEISMYREERNKEGRNIKKIIDDAIKRNYFIPHELTELEKSMYGIKSVDFTFDLQDKVLKVLTEPQEQVIDFIKRNLEEAPGLLPQLEGLILEHKQKAHDS
jgi:predicted RNA-binding protein YlxR (DUF448 family)